MLAKNKFSLSMEYFLQTEMDGYKINSSSCFQVLLKL